jgi:predicted nucleic acid-binding protein
LILLDTNVISAVMQRRPEAAVMSWLDRQSLLDLWLPSVVVFELRHGVAILPDSRRRRSLEQGLNTLLRQLLRDRIALARSARLATRTDTRHLDDTTTGLIDPFKGSG